MQAEQLRELINADEPLLLPSAFNALTAKLAESIGFEAVYLGGNLAGAMTAATEPMITMTEMANRSREITHATNLPLLVDGNAGFGDAAHTYRTIQKFAKTGIAGTHIEDQIYPKRLHYHAGRHHIIDTEEMVSKIKAAVQAREEINEDIVLIARTDAGRGNLRNEEEQTIEDAVDRLNTYLSAGADGGILFPDNCEEIEYAANHVEGPLSFNMIEYFEKSHEFNIDEIKNLGFDFVVYPLSAQLVTVKAMRDFYESVYEDGELIIGLEESQVIQENITELIDLPKYYDIEERDGNR